jgi:3-deoxy-D-manno-octulosonic acid kinase
VVAACVSPFGCFYRGEVAREEVRDALDLARFLFDPQRSDSDRQTALHAAGVLVRRLHAAGVFHPDLNLRNILVSRGKDALRACVIDLEKCRGRSRLSLRQKQRMLKRLHHSARRFEARHETALTSAVWDEFYRGYGEPGPGAG